MWLSGGKKKNSTEQNDPLLYKNILLCPFIYIAEFEHPKILTVANRIIFVCIFYGQFFKKL